MDDAAAVQQVLDRVRERVRRSQPLRPLVGSRTALLVIDMQDFFVVEGMPMEVPSARSIVPRLNRLADGVRDAGGTVVWVRMTADTDRRRWSNFYAMRPAELTSAVHTMLRTGQRGHRLFSELEVDAGDLVMDKTRFSAFIPGSSELESVLSSREVDTLIIGGTLANVCCESTARDAMMLDYRVLFVSDANASLDELSVATTLLNVANSFGEVLSTAEALELLAR